MTFEEYRRQDATSLAELIRKGDIQAAEVIELAIQRAEAVNPQINAIIYPMYELARQMSQSVDSRMPFAGVPFLLKDLSVHLKGMPIRSGSRGYAHYSSARDSYIVEQYRQAGLIFMGKTNTPEFGLTPYTEPQALGSTRNPWNRSRTSGGSSGGSAAAVAAGITPIATASDGGGSIRIPASNNGIFGLKPSRGWVSLGPDIGEMWSAAVVEGCVSRSVRDTAALLDVLTQKAMPGEPYIYCQPDKPFSDALNADPKPLRIGFSTAHPFGFEVEKDCIDAIKHTAALLESLGHHVEETDLPIHKDDLAKVFIMMVFGETSAALRKMSEDIGRPVTRADVEITTWSLHLLGKAYTAGDYAYARGKWNDISRRMGAFHERYDLLLTPTVSMAPFEIGALQPTKAENRLMQFVCTLGLSSLLKANVDKLAEKTFGYIPYTPLANMTGQPSMSVPLYWNAQQLPIGVMFTGAIGHDDLLLQLAGQLERAQPWMDKVAQI